MRNYPDFIQAFLEYTQYVEAPEKFLRWSAISTVAGALERKVWINFKDQISCYPNHYICLIGEPGLAKKSSSSRQAISLLQKVDSVRFVGAQMTTAGLISELQDIGAEKTFDWEDERYCNSSGYIYSSEAAVTFRGDMQNTLIQNLTDLYDCGPEGWNRDAAWTKRLKNEETKIFNPCINMLACSTPVWLVESIGRENLDSGFASRILFVVQKGRPERSFGWKKTPSMRKMVKQLVEDLSQISVLKGEFQTSQCFRDAFDEIDEENKAFLEGHPGHLLTGYYARKPWHLLKLSQVLQASCSNCLELTGKTLFEAKAMIEELEPEMSSAFSKVTASESGKFVLQLWDRIRTDDIAKKHKLISMKVINAWFWTAEPADVYKAMNQLRALGKLGEPQTLKSQIIFQILDFSEIN